MANKRISNPLNPSMSVLMKLGSAVVHAEELISVNGHGFDRAAFEQMVADPELQAWIKAMRREALLPVKR